jgi:hypothetical protein
LKANNLLQYLDVGCMSGFLFCFCSFLCWHFFRWVGKKGTKLERRVWNRLCGL